MSEETVGTVVLSLVIPARGQADQLGESLPEVRAQLQEIGVDHEIIVVTERCDPGSQALAEQHGARTVTTEGGGYGAALRAGFRAASGAYLLTLDPDLLETAACIRTLWGARSRAEIIVASRYVRGSVTNMNLTRAALSRSLNLLFSRGLSLQVRDMSSDFRLYHSRALAHLDLKAQDYDVLQEILVESFAEGWRILEVPFHYSLRGKPHPYRRLWRFGADYARTFYRLWKLRNGILSADYDARAYSSPIPLQRYWQRSRYRLIHELIGDLEPVLDVGCGSSRIIGNLPRRSVSLDILLRKLRYARRFDRPLVQASGFHLPFANASFPCVVSSQVIEHVPKSAPMLDELCRVVAPGGRLVLGTPDYGHWEWRMFEWGYKRAAPGAYADEHISHYSQPELVGLLHERGFEHEASRYILNAELIMSFRKAEAAIQKGSVRMSQWPPVQAEGGGMGGERSA